MSRDRVLIVSDVLDAHVDRLMPLLRTADPVRLNASDVPGRTRMSLTIDGGSDWSGGILITTNGRRIDLAELRSVWWRKPGPYVFAADLTGQERDFAVEETDHAMRGLWASLDCYWLSHPEAIRRAGFKLEQLQRAARLGFEVPRTLVTTDPAAVREFCAGQVVYKVLSDPQLAARQQVGKGRTVRPRRVSTTVLTTAELADLEAVRVVPCQFQEYVPKRMELRVTVIGDEVFTAQIHSRDLVDWRGLEAELTFRVGDLPDDIAKRCLELTRSYGLAFSAIDLIVTPDGGHVFLEINPNGQFLFVQDRLPELRLDAALAACLLRGAN
jgi:glutathione synthase/RimK-type ligase-like ATP-grasp enzyme